MHRPFRWCASLCAAARALHEFAGMHAVSFVAILAFASAGVAVASCSRGLPQPKLVAPAPDTFIEVPYPPPAGKAEIVPAQPAEDAVWLDGQWSEFTSARWVWQAGGWLRVPEGAVFSPWRTQRRPDGRLFFAPPQWRDAAGKTLEAPPFLVRARRGDPASRSEATGDDLASPDAPPVSTGAPVVTPAPLLPDAGPTPPALSPDAALPGPATDGGRPAPTPQSPSP